MRFFAALFFVLTSVREIRAQERGAVTGLDISLESLDLGYYDRPYSARGTVYEVIGIATLRPAANATVRARLGGKWVSFIADRRGVFEITLVVPPKPDFDLGDYDGEALEIEVTKGGHKREYGFGVNLESPLHAIVRTDRTHYEPGDTVHVWSRIDDVSTGRPLSGVPLVIAYGRGQRTETVTSSSGAAAMDFTLSKDETSSGESVSIELDGKYAAGAYYSIGKRATTDLLVSLKATPETVGPGEPVSIEVEVRSVRGTPMPGAELSMNVSEQKIAQKTDAGGKVTFTVKAPLYSKEDKKKNRVEIEGTARHEGCRAADFHGSFRIGPAFAYNINVLVPRGSLVPEVNDRLIVSVETVEGAPAKAGTSIELRGSAFKGNMAKATLDRHGLASVPIHLARRDYAIHATGDCAPQTSHQTPAGVYWINKSQPSTTIEVMIEDKGKVVTKTEFCLPVIESALVLPFVKKPAVIPGESFEVAVERRPSARGLPVSVELFCGDIVGPVDAEVIEPSSNQVRLTAPKDRLGLCAVRARPILDANRFADAEPDVSEPVLVRPKVPSFPTLTLDREMYEVKGRALLTIHAPSDEGTSSGVPKSWAVVAVRDLAQHQGEYPFDEYFMKREIDQAVLDPSTKDADLLVRAAMTDVFGYKGNEATLLEMQYDAAGRAGALRNNAAGKWMVAVAQLLAKSLESGTVEQLATGRGSSRRFRADALNLALEGREEDWNGDGEKELSAQTLGNGKVTTDMLTELDPSFTFDTAARRVARKRLVHLLAKLAADLNPGETDENRPLNRPSVPLERILSDMVRRGVLSPTDLLDPWGNTFVLRKTGRATLFVFSADLDGFELLSPGPDGRVGTSDDICDPWEREIPKGTLYARVSGEDRLIAELSAISPGSVALDKLTEAYDRLNDEAVEEFIGDGLNGGLGVTRSGKGGGGGSGSGYGRGAGGLGGRRARSPKITMGGALTGLLREDFPATLYFKAEEPLSSSGNTTLEIPLAHAATTYLVEAIIWREDGWRWSASTEIHVNQDLLIDAPLPERAIVGDEVLLPVRISNRTDAARTVRVTVTGTDELGISPIETKAVQVPKTDTIEVPVKLSLQKAALGNVTIRAFDTNNSPIDAVRRHIVVKPSKRRAHGEVQEILRGTGKVSLVIPKGAEPLGTNKITVTTGPALFHVDDEIRWSRWLTGLTGYGPANSEKPDRQEMSELSEAHNPGTLSALIGADWANATVEDSVIEKALETLTDLLDSEKGNDAVTILSLSKVLMFLAPAALHMDKREALRKPLSTLVNNLRVRVENGAALFSDAPWLWAHSAAALLWTAPKHMGGKRAEELLKRARAAVVTVDGDPWFEGGRDDPDDSYSHTDYGLFVASVYLALAEIRKGNDDAAFKLVRSSARLVHFSTSSSIILRYCLSDDRIIAEAAAALLRSNRADSQITVIVDGEPHAVELTNGVGKLNIEKLGRGGSHSIEIKNAGSEIVMVRAQAEYSVDWTGPPPHAGPFIVRIDGKAGRVDDRCGLKLDIHNRIPRVVLEPIVEISLPAGAEVDEETKKRLVRFTVGEPVVSSDTLTLKLLPLRPQEETIIPLPWLWTAAGRFNGLGVTAWAADRPEAVTVLPAINVEVTKRAAAERAVVIGGSP